MIQLTPKAVEQLITALELDEYVRIGVQGGGCAGMSYAIEPQVTGEDEIDEEDILLDIPGVKIYVDPYSAELLKNTVVDYVFTLQQQGFVFNNPDANMTCGCGSSFG
tara:strand:- start:459 stop:779 length:321 start_codon:yes stop_codon:yes gene_type:complete